MGEPLGAAAIVTPGDWGDTGVAQARFKSLVFQDSGTCFFRNLGASRCVLTSEQSFHFA
jgi:hypothetical protein